MRMKLGQRKEIFNEEKTKGNHFDYIKVIFIQRDISFQVVLVTDD